MDLVDLFDHLRFAFDAAALDVARRFSVGGWWLLLAFLPFILFDLRRFLLPALALPVLRWFGLPRDRSTAHERFLATRPTVSAILAGYNEEAAIVSAIESLIETAWPGLEIIVVDDGSEDRTWDLARPYAERGAIRLLRNSAASGRGGKPSAMNLGLRMAKGEFLVFLDVDTSFDRDLLRHLIGPFHDPEVGVVAGNVKVRNVDASLWTRMQAVEYLLAIGLNKRWLDLFGTNYIASGACAAYRRTTLTAVQGFDVATAEDLDNSLKARKAGWKLVFAPLAIATTDAPETLRQLVRQRMRWDRDLVRVAFRKHLDLLDARRFQPRVAVELAQVLLVSVIANLAYAVYVVVMLVVAPALLAAIWLLCMGLYAVLSVIATAVMVAGSERRSEEMRLLAWAPLLPLYNEVIFRGVRITATVLEILRINQEDAYLPQSAWRNTPRF